MKTASKFLLLLLLLSFVTPGAAYAGGVNVQTFHQATGATYETTESAFLDRGPFGSTERSRELHLSAHYNYADNPLVEYNLATEQRTSVIVDGIHTLELAAGLQGPKWAATLVLPLHTVRLQNALYQSALGDLRLQGKIEVARTEDRQRALILVPELYLPSGSSDLFVSNAALGGGIMAAFEQDFGFLRAAANLGIRSFGGGVYREIDYRLQLPYSLAVSYPVSRKVVLNGEFFQSVTLPRNKLQNPGELYLGSKFRLREDIVGGAGISLGQADFLKANDVRIHLGVQFRLACPAALCRD